MLGNWQEQFPDCEPVAHLLRRRFPTRWVRFHSLPASKRYPEDASEYGMVLERHNRILRELAGPESTVILLTTGYSETADAVPPRPELGTLDPDAKPWRAVPMHDLEGDFFASSYWHVFASVWEWRPGVLDPIVRLVADDAIANVMVVDPLCRWLLHPYDGGMDVILESTAVRDRLRSSYAGWLSPRSDGL
jgi:hypothetical protein